MKEKLREMLVKSPAVKIATAEEAESFAEEIMDVAEAFRKSFEDGEFSLVDLKIVMSEMTKAVTDTLMPVTTAKDGIVMLIFDLVKKIYYSEEGLNNPDIPVIPDWLEDNLEAGLFDFALPMVAKAASAMFRV